MGTAWNPNWWKEEQHGQTWERVKDAMKRDWEQTLSDVGVKGKRDLDQDIDDTVKQAAGKDVIPPPNKPNAPGGTPLAGNTKSADKDIAGKWQDVENPMRYGFGAHEQYAKEFPNWTPDLETRLRGEWQEQQTGSSWDDIKGYVRQGFDRWKPHA